MGRRSFKLAVFALLATTLIICIPYLAYIKILYDETSEFAKTVGAPEFIREEYRKNLPRVLDARLQAQWDGTTVSILRSEVFALALLTHGSIRTTKYRAERLYMDIEEKGQSSLKSGGEEQQNLAAALASAKQSAYLNEKLKWSMGQYITHLERHVCPFDKVACSKRADEIIPLNDQWIRDAKTLANLFEKINKTLLEEKS